MSLNIPGHVLETGARLGLPTMFSEPFYVEQGGLGSYGADLHGSGRQVARLVDKILRGTPPGDIPIELDNHIHFVLNMKAAQDLGLAISAEEIRRADRVLQ
jgi:putative ABC transport system substrate-binding protein